MVMKKALLIVSVIFSALSVYAQFPGAANGKGQQAPNMGHIYGKIVDSAGKPISDASVILLQNKFDTVSKKRKEVLLKGLSTKANGEFSFSELPMFGALKLKISASGYKPFEQTVSFQMKMDAGSAAPKASSDPSQGMQAMSGMLNAIDKDLGNIKLSVDVQQLQTVVVTASKPMIQMDIDKKVFNVDKNIVSAGGTAVDIMKNVPSVQVDIDGNVKLRNASPQIYIDGRPTTLSLDQIPADAIESVEVITNPSAKFDASGGNAGILNIILKKNKKTGYNGNIMAGVDRRGGMNGGGSFNVRQDKFNVSASVMTNQMRNRATGNTERFNFADTPQTLINQNNLNKTKGGFMFGRLGIDYFITNRTTLSLAGIKVHGEFNPNDVIDIYTDSLLTSGILTNRSRRSTGGKREFNAHGLQLGMKHNFPRAGEEWTADMNFFSGKNESNSLYTTDYFGTTENKTGTQYQQVLSDGKNSFLTLQTDYVRPFKGSTKLETGVRAQLRNIKNFNETYIQGIGLPDFIKIPSATNNYKNNDNVYAAYISLRSTIKNFGYQVGLRAESSSYKGELTNTGEKFSNSYPVSLFPSVFLSQKLKKNQELQMSYTRRINRPNFFQLIPYVDYTDSLNITRGNPNLVPEFTNSLEMSYGKTFKGKNSILASVYYKHTNNLITRYLDEGINPITGNKDIISTFINANSSYAYGSELTSINTITKWWDVTTNVNLYNSKINTDNISGTSQDAMWSWFGKFNNNFKLPKNFTIQLTADYQSKTNLPVNNSQGFGGPPMMQAQSASQGYIRPFWGMDIAVKKSFMKNNAAALTLNVSDIFGTRKSSQHTESAFFVQDYSRLNNPQMVRLNFTYRFGKMGVSLFKRQNMKGQAGGMSGATEGMQQ